jgi:hypothetical protein
MKRKYPAGVSDDIIFALNTLSVLALLFFVLNDLAKQFPTWIYLNTSGSGWGGSMSIEVLPLVAVVTVFFVTQIYLNYKLLQKNSHKTGDNQSQHAGKDAHIEEQNG